jgi:hypothetical protein
MKMREMSLGDARGRQREDTEGKGPLLAEKTAVKEVVRKSLRSVPGLAQEEHEAVEVQVTKLVEAIQQLQARVTELELQEVPSTPAGSV